MFLKHVSPWLCFKLRLCLWNLNAVFRIQCLWYVYSSDLKLSRKFWVVTGKEGSATLQYPLLMKSNYAAWLIKICVDLYVQGVWDAVEHCDIEERKDRTTLVVIYRAKGTFFSCWQRRTRQR